MINKRLWLAPGSLVIWKHTAMGSPAEHICYSVHQGFTKATVLIDVTLFCHRTCSEESKGWPEGLFVLPGSCELQTQGEVCSRLFTKLKISTQYDGVHVLLLIFESKPCSDLVFRHFSLFVCPFMYLRSMRGPWSMFALYWKMNQEITRLLSWRSLSIRPWRKVSMGGGKNRTQKQELLSYKYTNLC